MPFGAHIELCRVLRYLNLLLFHLDREREILLLGRPCADLNFWRLVCLKAFCTGFHGIFARREPFDLVPTILARLRRGRLPAGCSYLYCRARYSGAGWIYHLSMESPRARLARRAA